MTDLYDPRTARHPLLNGLAGIIILISIGLIAIGSLSTYHRIGTVPFYELASGWPQALAVGLITLVFGLALRHHTR